MSGSDKRGKHAAPDSGKTSIGARARRRWQGSPILQTAALALALAAALAALFWFAVFGDFGGSADFVYNQF